MAYVEEYKTDLNYYEMAVAKEDIFVLPGKVNQSFKNKQRD